MRVVQATFGVFHSFELAAELLKRNYLERIYSTFPWRRIQREGIPREYVETFPWLHAPQIVAGKAGPLPASLFNHLRLPVATTFDKWVARRIPPCDVLVALSGAALRSARLVQQRGGKAICDRGSTHHVFQHRTLKDEYARWGMVYNVREDKQIAREVQIYAESDAIVVPSQVARRSFLFEGVPEHKVFTIPYGVRLERFSKVADAPADRFEVLFVGGVSLRKGIPYLLQAFARVRHPHKRLRIVGSVSKEILQLLPKLPQEHVEFLGVLPQPHLPEIFSSSHVLILPSVEEGLALVQGQALACGCPVIATEATGAEDLFTNGVEGFILQGCNVEELAARMQQMAEDPVLQRTMSESALRRVRALGGWSTYGERWEELLHRLVKT